MTAKDDKRRRALLQGTAKADLINRGEIASLAGLQVEADVKEGVIETWSLFVSFKDRPTAVYSMQNADGAHVLRDGIPVKIIADD